MCVGVVDRIEGDFHTQHLSLAGIYQLKGCANTCLIIMIMMMMMIPQWVYVGTWLIYTRYRDRVVECECNDAVQKWFGDGICQWLCARFVTNMYSIRTSIQNAPDKLRPTQEQHTQRSQCQIIEIL